jgi:ABC-2 type transport system ATP-binding protein
VGIIQRGEMIAVDSIDGLRSATGSAGQLVLTVSSPVDALVPELESIDGVSRVTPLDGSVAISCSDGAKAAVIHRAHEVGIVDDVQIQDSSLEDLFVSYTGGGS